MTIVANIWDAEFVSLHKDVKNSQRISVSTACYDQGGGVVLNAIEEPKHAENGVICAFPIP